jgi:DNA (cytosine-5)-methyltransferase 1
MKLMSLFDGSGGFPLAASMCGIEPVYAAEVEPYPIAVTKNRFPSMQHLGDVSKVKGGEIEPVDIITFGSPCQDMSIAGKRAGLKHADIGDAETTRSGLFLEAIRIIKEMRESTNGVYPRYAIWENVPGAFSSNRGEDFRTVLEEFIRVKEKDVVMPSVPAAGWAYADCISGDGWSVAYRTFDAQYWGVPQRRRRIYLVADFRGECAQEILFKRESLRGYFEAGRTPWQGIAADAQNCVGADDRAGEVPYTLKIRSGCEGDGKGALVQKDKSATLATNNDQYLFQPISVSYSFDSLSSNSMKSKNPHSGCRAVTVAKTLDTTNPNPTKNQGGIAIVQPIIVGSIVRRLTPTECARLQGFPSWWGVVNPVENLTDEDYTFWLGVRNTYAEINGKATKEYTKQQMLSWYNKLHSDSAEYKMWGNGIALPNALYVMQGIAEVERVTE